MTPSGSAQLLVLARDLASQPDQQSTMIRVVELAARTVNCGVADLISRDAGGVLRVTASTDVDISSATLGATRDSDIGWPEPRSGGSPGFRLVDPPPGARHLCSTESRYARRVFEATGFRAELTVPVGAADERRQLFLRFFSVERERWRQDDAELATDFAELAALAIDRAALRASADNLRAGLETSRLIGTATGILMARHRLTNDRAFALLCYFSQDNNRKLRDVAEDVVLLGELPPGWRPALQAARLGTALG